MPRTHQYSRISAWLSYLLCGGTLFLIFLGGVVTSKNVGLSVPDWPTSYGYHMWRMPWSMWTGGALYEHSHRVLASGIGCVTIALTLWLMIREARRLDRLMAWLALVLVCLQGVLGGLTVLYKLPVSVSTAHGVTAQLFFSLTVILAYRQSPEWHRRHAAGDSGHGGIRKWAIGLFALIFLQLMIAAFMRHDMKHQGGVAVPDFPAVAGQTVPAVNAETVEWVNQWREDAVWEHGADFDLTDPVKGYQISTHIVHRFVAFLIVLGLLAATWSAKRMKDAPRESMRILYVLDALVLAQVILGALTVWSNKGELITSLHVVTGAILLGTTMLLVQKSQSAGEKA